VPLIFTGTPNWRPLATFHHGHLCRCISVRG
jgi:hypothetical protein